MRGKLLLPALAVCLSMPNPASANAELVWQELVHDFGAFSEDMGTVTCVMTAVNTGNEPAIILDATANCGCTTPHYSKAPVAPGDTLRVEVGYNPSGRPGAFSKNVRVVTNATPARTTLTIKGTVIGSPTTLQARYPVDAGGMRLRQDHLMFGKVKSLGLGNFSIEGYNSGTDTIHPTLASAPAHITAVVSPASVPPGRNFIVSLNFNGAKAGAYDVVTDTITIGGGAEPVPVVTNAIVYEDFGSLTDKQLSHAPVVTVPDVIDAGNLSTMSGATLNVAPLEIANRGKSPLLIRRIYTPDTAVTLTPEAMEVKPGKKIKVKITLNGAALRDRDMLNDRIILITNDPQHPRTVVRLVATLHHGTP